MMIVAQILLLGFLVIFENTHGAARRCSSNQPVSRVFPLRRRITFPATTGSCYLSHSGLLLEMTDGKACVLEYSTDGNARLYGVKPMYFSFPCNWWKECYIVSQSYSGAGTYRWSRDATGYEVNHHSITPKAARDTMQRIMGHHYHMTKRNSHQAQANLRKMWGLPAEDDHTSKRSICSCVPRTLSNFLPHDESYNAYQMVKRACRK
ncbi:uncharacterized protein LOC110239770 [Exaiptasia diaphana]|uniref:Lipocalin n=1 Tax=Exaiptasia diaphana TaxID=2652724 RepID=A0A913X9J5_EXADI|nr:uncharacterized protein LOC110239770 [Exaiptasia diaphana]KXJ13812.1 hypothetical protein AC249_AIPGENE4889 [Exaiptasia diaphana]